MFTKTPSMHLAAPLLTSSRRPPRLRSSNKNVRFYRQPSVMVVMMMKSELLFVRSLDGEVRVGCVVRPCITLCSDRALLFALRAGDEGVRFAPREGASVYSSGRAVFMFADCRIITANLERFGIAGAFSGRRSVITAGDDRDAASVSQVRLINQSAGV